MTKERLYVIHTSEDGDVTIREVMLEELSEYDDWVPDHDCAYRDLTAEQGTILIKGRVVIPKPKNVVTEYEVE